MRCSTKQRYSINNATDQLTTGPKLSPLVSRQSRQSRQSKLSKLSKLSKWSNQQNQQKRPRAKQEPLTPGPPKHVAGLTRPACSLLSKGFSLFLNFLNYYRKLCHKPVSVSNNSFRYSKCGAGAPCLSK